MALRTFSFPLQKQTQADIAKRMVWGIATSETAGPDHQGDIVTYDGSLKAFRAWERNVREMHTNKAVGRCVSVIPMPKEKKILVGVRISEGAPDTWAKVKDGTLRAFSIGGYPTEERKRWNTTSKSFVNYIHSYRLTELSLCDSPANPECRVTLLTKRNHQKLASDVLADQGDIMDKKIQKAVREKFSGFANSIDKDDELVLVRKSDLVASEDGSGVVTLKADAPVETFTKDDAEGVVPNLDEEEEGGEEGDEHDEELGTDLNQVAESLLEAHDVLHELAGQECGCNEGDEGGDGDHEMPEEGEDETTKSLRARMRKNRMALRNGFTLQNGTLVPAKKKKKFGKKKALKLISKAIGSHTEGLAKAIDAINAKLGIATVQPMLRKGEGEGDVTPTNGKVKTAAGILQKSNSTDVALDEQAVKNLSKSVRDLTVETRTLIQKRDSGADLTSEEKVRILSVGDDLSRAKIAYQAATGRSPADAYAEA